MEFSDAVSRHLAAAEIAVRQGATLEGQTARRRFSAALLGIPHDEEQRARWERLGLLPDNA